MKFGESPLESYPNRIWLALKFELFLGPKQISIDLLKFFEKENFDQSYFRIRAIGQ